MEGYGKRVCMVCGKEFQAEYLAHITCSKECRTQRKRDTDRRSQQRLRARIVEEREKEKARLARVWEENDLLKAQVEHLQYVNDNMLKELEELRKKLPKAADFPQLQECLRSNVRGLHLPCGHNVLCWQNTPCERCKGMIKPRPDLLGGSGLTD